MTCAIKSVTTKQARPRMRTAHQRQPAPRQRDIRSQSRGLKRKQRVRGTRDRHLPFPSARTSHYVQNDFVGGGYRGFGSATSLSSVLLFGGRSARAAGRARRLRTMAMVMPPVFYPSLRCPVRNLCSEQVAVRFSTSPDGHVFQLSVSGKQSVGSLKDLALNEMCVL